jgi:hypothetical protein
MDCSGYYEAGKAITDKLYIFILGQSGHPKNLVNIMRAVLQ